MPDQTTKTCRFSCRTELGAYSRRVAMLNRANFPEEGISDSPSTGRDSMMIWAPAKVNLHLEILGRRSDGMHEIETLIAPVDLFDTLEVHVLQSDELILTCNQPGLPLGSENLVYKAADELRRSTGKRLGASIRLVKRIPSEAGLGGGSSDAATTLMALHRLWNLELNRNELSAIAARIGSDVGFFLTGSAAWCTGRGETATAETTGAMLHLVLVKPPFGLSTAEMYKRVSIPKSPVCGDAIREALRMGDLESLARHLHNRLQEPAFAAQPIVESVVRDLQKCDPLGCLMSGSGSSVFALCRDRADALRIAAEYRAQEPKERMSQVFTVRSRPNHHH